MAMLQRITTSATSYPDGWYWASDRFTAKTVSVAADRYTVLSPAAIQVDVGGESLTNITQQTLDLSLDTNWDHGQSIGTWTANTAYEVGDLVRPTTAWLEDGANNASVSYATSAMLSNTIPGPGVVSADGTPSGVNYIYNAFDQSTGTRWQPSNPGTHWLKYDFGNGKVINKFRYYGAATYSPKIFTLDGSNDDSNWTTLYTGTNVADPGYAWTPYFTFSNNNTYRYYRLYVTENYAADVLLLMYELHLVSTPSLVYRCTTAGTSHATTHPTMPITEGSTVTESGSTLQWTAYLDNTVASNRAGLDYYVYACTPTSGTVPKLLLSKQSTYPLGYTASNSRKIGGFHCECEYIGANCYGTTAHGLYGYVKGDILPASVWDLRWKSNSLIGNIGQVYDAGRQIWVAIYHTSGTDGSPTIAYNGTILDTIDWNDSVDAGAVLGMRLPRDSEFQSLAMGSNEQTNIYGSADPGTGVGAVDTAGTRMVSNIGVEGACGQMWQWLNEQGYRFNGATLHYHVAPGSFPNNTGTAVASNGSTAVDVAPAWAWYDLPLALGQLYRQGTYGDVKVIAGGVYGDGNNCGSRSRSMDMQRDSKYPTITFRLVARHIQREFI